MSDAERDRSRRLGAATLLVAVLAAGCDRAVTDNAAPANAPVSAPVVATQSAVPQQWLGRWLGPEGTSLTLEHQQSGAYRVTIVSLDGPTSYDGAGLGDRIEFSRGGVTESIHASNGEQTGMKWLADKSDCLTIKSGEGYCRN